MQVLYLLAWLAPILPLVIAGLMLMGVRLIPSAIANTLAFFSAIIGLFLTGVSYSPIWHGITLTIAVASSFLIWSGRDGKVQPTGFAKAGMAIATAAALWSLLAIPMILIQARVISGGFPYCIANHWPYSEINTFHELRGFSFYTTRTGLKDTSKQFLHGVLVVNREIGRSEGFEYFNWSPRRYRFDRLKNPHLFLEPVTDVCIPN
ncbi:hypothetical protein [Ruegeria arenilitoris]|uniref:hypothetical protein n=1 Tax=Ruegeria arenilitoris TaxID=1173585 RepID=UPI00147A30CC|nr:hypothetical protein [Ruegeria arenilitoris]